MKRRTTNEERRTGGLPAAFTLIELMVVMVIAAIIMAVSLPSFISMGRGAGMRTAVNNVSSTIALSRQWAITHREQITFVASSNLVYQNDVGAWVTNPAYCATNQSGEIVQKGVPLPLDVNFGASVSLTFKTDGGLDGSVTNQRDVVLKYIRGDQIPKIISVNGLTGGIKVQ